MTCLEPCLTPHPLHSHVVNARRQPLHVRTRAAPVRLLRLVASAIAFVPKQSVHARIAIRDARGAGIPRRSMTASQSKEVNVKIIRHADYFDFTLPPERRDPHHFRLFEPLFGTALQPIQVVHFSNQATPTPKPLQHRIPPTRGGECSIFHCSRFCYRWERCNNRRERYDRQQLDLSIHHKHPISFRIERQPRGGRSADPSWHRPGR